MSLLHEPSRVLITGDSIFNVLGLRWPMKSLCTDFRMSRRTAHELGELDYEVAAFTTAPRSATGPRAGPVLRPGCAGRRLTQN